jgi:hypothetical protein
MRILRVFELKWKLDLIYSSSRKFYIPQTLNVV